MYGKINSTEEKLKSIQKAIDAIENGAQEYRIGSRMVKRAELKTLYDERQRLENKLQQEINNQYGGCGITVATFDTR